MQATGKFEVTLQPLDAYAEGIEGMTLSRMSIDKTFSGDLAGTSKGEMFSVRTPIQSSAGYVAIEQVKGTLHGKNGTFVLQHFATMSNGGNRQMLEVVPDSGTGELTGLSGNLTIKIEDGEHGYEFEYSLG